MNTENWKFKMGDEVKKIKGSMWHGTVCGFYSSVLTERGYAVQSKREIGSVQIYPEAALELMTYETSEASHYHCFHDQEGHEMHLVCCLCGSKNPVLKSE